MKRNILSLALALGLFIQPVELVEATEDISQVEANIEEKERTVELAEPKMEADNNPEVDADIKLINTLSLLLTKDQQIAFDSLLNNEELNQLLVNNLLVHEGGDFVQAAAIYEEILSYSEISAEELELLFIFKNLADNNILLTDYIKTEMLNEESIPMDPEENQSIDIAATSLDEPVGETSDEASNTDHNQVVDLEDAPTEDEEPSIEIVSQKEVNYRGYLVNESGLITDYPEGELIRTIGDLSHSEVSIMIEANTSNNSTWLFIRVMGTDIRGWVDADNVSVEMISNAKDASYRGYLKRPTDTINTKPWGTKGYQEIQRVGGLLGREVEVLKEATTQRATWLYVNVRGTNVEGWIDKNGVDIESISSQKNVSYRGYLSRSSDTINTKPWGTPDFKEIRHVDELVGREVEVLKEATTQRATWLYVNVRGTNISGWIDKAGVNAESISSQTNIRYRGILTRATDTLNTLPWGTPGFKEIRHVEDLVGREVEVQREATTQRATWLYVHVRGTNINGWVDKAGVKAESITNQKNVNYRGYLARRTDTINTLPWGVRGFKEICRVTNLQGREVEVMKEAVTPRATWLYVYVRGTNIKGWVDKAGVTPERISSQKTVNYQAYLSRSSDTINTQPWGTIGNRVIRRVNDLTNRKVNVTREAKTQRATWAFITVPGTNISGWVDKAGLRDNILIYLDPGHGGGNRNGGNPGAVYNGVREQDLNLNISLQVRDRLEKLGYQVVMSRENDNNSYHNNWREDLYARPAHANEIGADILVSIHHNASGIWDSSMNGIETYVYGVNPEYPPLPENKNSHNNPQRMNESRKLANAVHKELISNTGARDRGVQSGAFIVVREAKMPAVLLELGFMSNRAELNKLTTTSYQQKLVNGIVTGIHNYFLI